MARRLFASSFHIRTFSLGSAAALLLLLLTASPARAEKDIVQFFNNVDIPENSTAGDVVCFFCNVRARGTIKGDTVVFFGKVHIQERASQDVVDFFGRVDADDNSSIGGDLVNFFGATQLGENVTVDQDAVVMFGSLHAAQSASIHGDRVVQPAWVFWGPLLLIALGVGFLIRELRWQRQRRFLRGY